MNLPFNDDEPIDRDLRRTVPRPRRAFSGELEVLLLQEFDQTRKSRELTMGWSFTVQSFFRLMTGAARLGALLAAVLLVVAGALLLPRLLPSDPSVANPPLSQLGQAPAGPDCFDPPNAGGLPPVLTETIEPWLIAPGCRVIIIAREQIEFTSSDLQTGDIVTVSEVRFEGDNAVQPLTTDARLILITSQPGDFAVDVVGLLVRDTELQIAELAERGSRFAVLETPATSDNRPTLVYVPSDSGFNPGQSLVLDVDETLSALETCARVDVIGVFQFVPSEDVTAGTPLPLPDMDGLGRGARVVAAPVGEGGGWLMLMRDPDEAVRVQNFLTSGGLIYLQMECGP